MKSLSLRALAGLMALAAASASSAQSPGEKVTSPKTDQSASVSSPEREGDADWRELERKVKTKGDDAASILQTAETAKSFHTTFPQHPHAAEAKRLEAVCLVEAVSAGSSASRARMEATVRAVRNDQNLPASERAIVAGTHDFSAATPRIRSLADMQREYEAVARGLMREFPDQPQGYVSLLTQALQRDAAKARSMAMEVVDASAAPAESRKAAQQLVTRLDLVGRPLAAVVGESLLGEWKRGKAGLIYFWATWSPQSIALGEKLKARLAATANVLAICLDAPDGALELGAIDRRETPMALAAAKMPGRVIELPNGHEDELAVRLGADAAPLLYVVDASGHIADVRGLDDLEAKLKTAGF